MFSETSLTSDFNNSELGLHNYHIFRKDRNAEQTGKSRNGGVMIAVKKDISALRLPIGHLLSEEVWVLVKINQTRNIFGCFYTPPMSPRDSYERHSQALEILSQQYDEINTYVVAGDYNLPHIIWGNDNLGIAVDNVTSTAEPLVETLAFLNFFQKNNIGNINNRTLDLVFSNDASLTVQCAIEPLLKCDRHHPALEIRINCDISDPLVFEHILYDFKKCNYHDMFVSMSGINWDFIFDSDNLDFNVDNFYAILHTIIENFVPKIKFKSNFSFPIWFNNELKVNIFKKKEAHKKYKLTGKSEDYDAFSFLRKLCKEQTEQCYRDYIKATENKVFDDPRHFWKYVHETTKNRDIPSEMKLDNQTAVTGKSIANLFAKSFSSVYENSDNTIENLEQVIDHGISGITNISEYHIDPIQVFEKLSSLDINKSPGPDALPPSFLRNCAAYLTHPLTLLFNQSLESGYFAQYWKETYITPIFKNSGEANDVLQYRPVAIMSQIPKILEAIVAEFLKGIFKNILDSKQHGFVEGRSVDTNLVVYENTILEALENGFDVDAIYTDFSKAFDKVNQKILVAKLKNVGLNGTLLRWSGSCISKRRNTVKINNMFLSDPYYADSGVPQGAHLSPLFFNIFILDVIKCFRYASVLLFADDVKIYTIVDSFNAVLNMRADLERFEKWCKLNKMVLNPNKCKYIQFTRSNTPHFNTYQLCGIQIERVNLIRDLGVFLDEKVLLSEHIQIISNKALKMLGFIKRQTRDFTNIEAIKILYISLVRSHLETSVVVWSPFYAKYIDQLEKIQHRFLRYIAFKLKIPWDLVNYGDLMNLLNIESLQQRRINADQLFAHKLINGKISCPELLSMLNFYVPPRRFREDPVLFQTEQHRTNYGTNNPINRIMNNANLLDADYFNTTLNKFKTIVRSQGYVR